MTEIIMYRNPLEAAMWHALMGGDGSGVLIFLAVLCLGLLWAGVYALHERMFRRNHFRSSYTHTTSRLQRLIPGPGLTATVITLVATIGLHLYNVS